jgi:hypothetical protein
LKGTLEKTSLKAAETKLDTEKDFWNEKKRKRKKKKKSKANRLGIESEGIEKTKRLIGRKERETEKSSDHQDSKENQFGKMAE